MQSILPDGDLIYVGGAFNFVDGQPLSGLAQWDGLRWSALGDSRLEFDSAVDAIQKVGEFIFINGTFARIVGQPVKNFARWDGVKWTAMLSGGRGAGVWMKSATDTAIALGVISSFDFGFAKHHGLAIYHVPPRLAVEGRPEGPRVYRPGPAWHYRLERSASLTEGSWTLAPNPQDGPGRIRYVDLPKDRPSTSFRLRRIPGLTAP